jgi:hypothetical protein
VDVRSDDRANLPTSKQRTIPHPASSGCSIGLHTWRTICVHVQRKRRRLQAMIIELQPSMEVYPHAFFISPELAPAPIAVS